MEIFYLQLIEYNPELIINDFESAYFTNVEILKVLESDFDYQSDYIYILDTTEITEELLTVKSNFIVLRTLPFAADLRGAYGNFLILSEISDCALAYHLTSLCCQAYTRFLAQSSKFLEVLLHENSSTQLLKTVSILFDNPITLMEESFHPVGSENPYPIFANEMKNFLDYGIRIEHENWPDFWKKINVEDFYNEDSPVYMKDPEYGFAVLIQAINIDSGMYYYLMSFNNNREFDYSDRIYFALISSLIKDFLKKEKASLNLRNEHLSAFFKNIVEGILTDEAGILQQVDSLRIPFSDENQLLIFKRHTTENISFQELLMLSNELRQILNGNIFLYQFKIVIIAHRKLLLDFPGKELLKWLKKHRNWHVGVSFPFSSAGYLKQAYSQCMAALDYGPQFFQEQRYFFYSTVVKPHFIAEASKHLEKEQYILPLAKQIVQYDRENHTEYAKTLHMYVKYLKDAPAVAKILHVHKNTVFYRIERAEELFHIRPDDYLLLNNLSLSFELIL